ncbi:MAG: hypothetical protein PF638_12880 [Candidatus Delongbacteria bacterium]|jgi:hypothetical protein|nr:hypothetical protein [Candidatus Delongbacteria bacterium]
MKLKGNYYFFYGMQFISGILTYFLCQQYGLSGIALGFIPFSLAMLLVIPGHKPDEREMDIFHKSNSYETIFVAVIMAMVYLFLPDVNWFYIFVASISIVRGVIGLILCIVK